MNLNSSVESIKIYQSQATSLIVISGWAINEDSTVPSLEFLINDKLVEFNCKKSVREDILKENCGGEVSGKGIPCGFFCTSFVKRDRLDKVVLKTEDNRIIFTADKNDISKYIISNSVLNETESYVYDDQTGVCRISGWAYSILNEQINFEITDTEKNKCDISWHYELRNDIVDKGLVPEEDKLCGYVIQFQAQQDKKYILSVRSESDSREVNFEPSKPEKKAGAVHSLITNINPRTLNKAWLFLKRYGFKNTIKRLKQGYQSEKGYDNWFRANRVSHKEMEEQRTTHFEYEPKISLIVPTFNTPLDLLDEMIQSVLEQSYPNWELCIADASNPDSNTRKALKEYQDKDNRIVIRLLDGNYGISGNTNKAFEIATGEYCGLLDHDDFLEPDALFEVVKLLNKYPYDSVYTDEDKYEMEIQKFSTPNFKPDFAIDTLTSHNYITHFFVSKTSIIRDVGGEHSEYDGAQDYDLILRCSEKSNAVGHVAKILYHWRVHPGSTAGDPEQKTYCYEAGRKAISDHLVRCGIKGNVRLKEKPYWGFYKIDYDTSDNPLVSIIIPNCDNKELLEQCINSIFDLNTYKNIEIVIVENNSKSKETFEYYQLLEESHTNVKVVNWGNGEFNYSAINNFGVKYANGEYILLLNNDTKLINPNSIQEMLGVCMRDDVGAVGAKLLYSDNSVQHAGIVVGLAGSAGHVFLRIPKDDPGYFMRTIINCNYSAVTAACMMTKKSLYEQVGGFSEEFKVAFNDVDYCLKLRNLNKAIVFTPYSLWYHYESVSRQYETDMKRIKRFDSEVRLFQNKWNSILVNGDPFYNKNFKSDAHLYNVD